MLSDAAELHPAFTNPSTHNPKRLECIRVDGATDEGPSHDEVKFLWAARHLKRGKQLVTLVSSQSSGSSYLNRVELQNSCLALAHSNLFIPSTLSGSAFSPDTREADMDRVRNNLELATSVYIDQVDKINVPVVRLSFTFTEEPAQKVCKKNESIYLYFLREPKRRKKSSKEVSLSYIKM